MKITLEQAVNGVPALRRLGEEKLPARLSLTFARIISKLQMDVRIFEKERQRLFEQYGESDGERVKIPADKIVEFSEQLTELLETEVEIPGIGQINIATLEDAGKCPKCGEQVPASYKANDLVLLDWLITDAE